jgi:hypothetical protein
MRINAAGAMATSSLSASTSGDAHALLNGLYGAPGVISGLKKSCVSRIIIISVVGIAGGVILGCFWIPAGIVGGIVLGIVPHFTPIGALPMFFKSQQIADAKVQEIYNRSSNVVECNFSANSPQQVESCISTDHKDAVTDTHVGDIAVVAMTRVWMCEYATETDPDLKSRLLDLYNEVLGVFAGGKSKEALVRAIRMIGVSELSDARKAMFTVLVADYAGTGAGCRDVAAEQPGVLSRVTRWLGGFVHG